MVPGRPGFWLARPRCALNAHIIARNPMHTRLAITSSLMGFGKVQVFVRSRWRPLKPGEDSPDAAKGRTTQAGSRMRAGPDFAQALHPRCFAGRPSNTATLGGNQRATIRGCPNNALAGRLAPLGSWLRSRGIRGRLRHPRHPLWATRGETHRPAHCRTCGTCPRSPREFAAGGCRQITASPAPRPRRSSALRSLHGCCS